MKPSAFCLTALLIVMTGCGDDAGPGETAGMPTLEKPGAREGQDYVIIEAEEFAKHGGAIEPPMRVCTDEEIDEEASRGKYLIIDGGAGKPGDTNPDTGGTYPARWGAVSYTFTVAEAGKYRFWGRKLYEDGCGNSFTLVVNGGPPVKFADGTTGKWHWHKYAIPFELNAGENKLEILNREDGVKLDKFIFTRKLQFVPVGTE